MEFFIITVGKWKASPEKALYEDYMRRMPWKVRLHELDVRERSDGAKQKQEEAEKIMALCASLGVHKRIALDETGKTLASRELATVVRQWRDEQAVSKIACIIGGHAGLDSTVTQQADMVLSFGRMTWPHLLVRPMLAEQIYRTYSILSGHPYHRD
jgi:23S rRNA (pseudouridine1915-N3)-methyltransferase